MNSSKKNCYYINRCLDKKENGVITVFLALVFPLIFSLISTSYKSLISMSVSNYSRRILNMALESTLGDYYRPLYDEYNIFGLKSYGDSEGQTTENLKRRITEVIDNSINTQSRFNAYPLTVGEPQITQVTGLLDYGGELYRKQAVEYAKYDEFAQLLEILLEKCNLLEEQSETSTVLQEKMALEEELAEIDERILTLMELIDGIQFSGNEIMTDRHGNVLTQDYFIKMLQTSDCSAISMGINNAKIYDSLKDKYFNPIPVLEALRSEGEIYIDNKRKVEACEETLKDIAEQADAKISYLEELIENKAETAVIEEVKAQIAELNEVYEKICEENQNYRELLDESYSNGYDRIYEMETVFSSVRYLTDDALQTIRYIKDKQDTIRPKVMDFGETLSRISDIVSTELMSDFNNSYENMKKYVGIDTEAVIPNYDIDGMETTLSANMKLLNSLDICRIKDMPTDVSEEGEIAWFSCLDESIEKYTGLRYEGLYFDYSNIQFETQKNTILSGFTELFAGSFYDLLIPDYDTTSEKEIMDGNLPSEWIGVAYESGMENPTEDIEDKSGSELLAITDNSADIGSISDVLKDSMVNIIEKIMFIMYLRGNFNNYLSTEKREDRPTEYEIEYIICGHPEDRDNLEAIAFRILMLRLIINTVHVFTDSDKVTQANTFAMSVVGFTGLPFLTALVKYVVLFIWAFEQSAIETMAIMMGREIPLITTKDCFVVRFEELLLINKQYIREKAEKLKKKGISLDYSDYLNIFLLIRGDEKLNYRSMDLIQSHIRFEYDTSFSLSDCCFGYGADVEFIPAPEKNIQSYVQHAEICYR